MDRDSDGKELAAEDLTSCFHVSIAWAKMRPEAQAVTHTLDPNIVPGLSNVKVPVEAVKAKIGNIIKIIDLGDRESKEKKRKWLGGMD